MLSTGESHGYALIQEVNRLSGDKIKWTGGMLYPVLHPLELTTSAHFTLAGAETSFPITVPTDELKEAREILDSRSGA